jgi:hypothetical protein
MDCWYDPKKCGPDAAAAECNDASSDRDNIVLAHEEESSTSLLFSAIAMGVFVGLVLPLAIAYTIRMRKR